MFLEYLPLIQNKCHRWISYEGYRDVQAELGDSNFTFPTINVTDGSLSFDLILLAVDLSQLVYHLASENESSLLKPKLNLTLTSKDFCATVSVGNPAEIRRFTKRVGGVVVVQ